MEGLCSGAVLCFSKARRIPPVQPTHSPARVVREVFISNMVGFQLCGMSVAEAFLASHDFEAAGENRNVFKCVLGCWESFKVPFYSESF